MPTYAPRSQHHNPRNIALTSLLVLAANAPASAAPIFTSSSGTFGNPTIDSTVDSNATFSTERPTANTTTFSLGQPGEASMPNRLAFSVSGFATAENQLFSVGSLSYLNGQTFSGTNVSGVPFILELILNSPIQSQFQFQYQFGFNLTPNTDPGSTADTLTLSSRTQSQSFDFEQNPYSLDLLGFSLDRDASVS